ncbi:MAG: ribosome small subunit-dependent GTPase A [Gammaproteobacteria bacterium]|nr:ribosome small subunit-dependent GTPase A [Gammaproteobacteria bacterium]
MRDLKETHPILAQLGYHEMIGCFDSETDLDRLGRVMRQDRQRYSVITENGIVRAALTTGQRFDPRDKTAFPVVGDWVTLGSLEANNATTPITGRIPRRSKLSRRASGDNYLEQILVSNLDLIFVVSGLDQNFNLNRIQRFLTMAWSCGLPAILLLSKADIAEDADAKIKALEPILHGTKVYPVNMHDTKTLTGPLKNLNPGQCAALIGSSGVGKSSMINQILGLDHMPTQAVRAFDDKGRHTTTHRELCILPNDSGLIIDTPGMREAQIWFEPAQFAERYQDLLVPAQYCRFSDCRHDEDPDCAVRETALKSKKTTDLWRQYSLLQAMAVTE